eukprot:superscaffoldBa00002051_g12998
MMKHLQQSVLEGWYSSQTRGAVEIVGFENRDGDSPLRGITATPLSEELRGELSGPPVIRSEDVSHGPEERLSERRRRRWCS